MKPIELRIVLLDDHVIAIADGDVFTQVSERIGADPYAAAKIAAARAIDRLNAKRDSHEAALKFIEFVDQTGAVVN